MRARAFQIDVEITTIAIVYFNDEVREANGSYAIMSRLAFTDIYIYIYIYNETTGNLGESRLFSRACDKTKVVINLTTVESVIFFSHARAEILLEIKET